MDWGERLIEVACMMSQTYCNYHNGIPIREHCNALGRAWQKNEF